MGGHCVSTPIGEERLNTRVNAPGGTAVRALCDHRGRDRRYAGKPEAPGAGRSLFVYGFPPEDEPGVLGRLRELVAAS